MHAALDTTALKLKNDEIITYTNNSPDSLTSLWIHLEQNIYRPDSRARLVNGGLRRKTTVPATPRTIPMGAPPKDLCWSRSRSERGKEILKADYLVEDTRMQIRLPQPMAPKRQRTKQTYQVSLPGSGCVGRPHLVGNVEAG